jgi:hypothetical protein
MKQASLEKYLTLYIPWALALLFQDDPELSYLIAWLGSFFIFYITLTGWVKPLPDDLSISEQLMRPIFLIQIIYAGYTCCTSIFYFLNVLGYRDFEKINTYFLIDQEKLQLTAQCQRYYCLGHAAFVTGVLIFMRYPTEQRYTFDKSKLANILFVVALVASPLSYLCVRIPGASQFANQFNSLSFIAGTLALAFAIPEKRIWNTLICIILYFFNFYQALISGYKEPIIISVLVLGIFLYPRYKKMVTLTFVPFLIMLFVLLPTYNRIFRENAWSEETSADEATQLALNAALSKNSQDDDSNWGFLAFRLSEIDMFTSFARSTPEKVNFYGFKLVQQSAIAIVPRVFWPSKPITEELVMERVYDGDVVNRGSNVSAKPAFIVDAYLSGGGWGVFISLFLYGATAQLINNKSEYLFGGYILGTALIFSGLFQIMWRGLSFEFLINTIFWSYISMLMIHKLFVAIRILREV